MYLKGFAFNRTNQRRRLRENEECCRNVSDEKKKYNTDAIVIVSHVDRLTN